jgi:hypothetical protein
MPRLSPRRTCTRCIKRCSGRRTPARHVTLIIPAGIRYYLVHDIGRARYICRTAWCWSRCWSGCRCRRWSRCWRRCRRSAASKAGYPWLPAARSTAIGQGILVLCPECRRIVTSRTADDGARSRISGSTDPSRSASFAVRKLFAAAIAGTLTAASYEHAGREA